jgi:urease accessory protein
MPTTESLAGLLQLSSAALPIGAFSHSLGLEAAVEAGLVRDVLSAERWIGDQLECQWARAEGPLWLSAYAAWSEPDAPALQRGNDRLLALRESRELLLECTQTGHSLRQWLLTLPAIPQLRPEQRTLLGQLQPVAYACVHALAARALDLSADSGLHACAWSLLENLCSAAVKLVPLGQTQGQALLRRLALRLPQALARAQSTPIDAISNFAPMLAILSAQHESQYSRLFRS